MSDTQFFQTAMGRQFYERTLPQLAGTLARIEKQLERIGDALAREQEERARALGRAASGTPDPLPKPRLIERTDGFL